MNRFVQNHDQIEGPDDHISDIHEGVVDNHIHQISNATFERLFEIFDGQYTTVLKEASTAIAHQTEEIADIFYDRMLTIQEAHRFLDHSIVSERLHRSMSVWLKSLFLPLSTQDVNAHIQRQMQVGDVHARINIPMNLVNHGIRILKWECWHRLMDASIPNENLINALAVTNELLDYSSSLINESYVTNRMTTERNVQALRMHVMSYSLVVEIERLRSSLFDWFRQIITQIYQDRDPSQVPSIHSSDFGLWVLYKMELVFSENQDVVENLKEQMRIIAGCLAKIKDALTSGSDEILAAALADLNEQVTKAGWLLSSLAEQANEAQGARDPLTRLYNRRFLPAIMQQFIRTSDASEMAFAVLMCDIDKFKSVNDRYGHDNGDLVLREFGELLGLNVRANDFVFRYGGDEFLILLSGADHAAAMSVSEKIRQTVLAHPFVLPGHGKVQIQTSVGVALYDRHPDYLRVVKRADKALYLAKHSGSNRVVLAED